MAWMYAVVKVENQTWGKLELYISIGPPTGGFETPGVFWMKFEVLERWISIIGGAGTAFPCVHGPMALNHSMYAWKHLRHSSSSWRQWIDRQKSGMASVVDDRIDEWHTRLWACVHAKGGYSEHFLWFKSPHILMFRNKFMILCYCWSFVFLKVLKFWCWSGSRCRSRISFFTFLNVKRCALRSLATWHCSSHLCYHRHHIIENFRYN